MKTIHTTDKGQFFPYALFFISLSPSLPICLLLSHSFQGGKRILHCIYWSFSKTNSWQLEKREWNLNIRNANSKNTNWRIWKETLEYLIKCFMFYVFFGLFMSLLIVQLKRMTGNVSCNSFTPSKNASKGPRLGVKPRSAAEPQHMGCPRYQLN